MRDGKYSILCGFQTLKYWNPFFKAYRMVETHLSALFPNLSVSREHLLGVPRTSTQNRKTTQGG